MSDYAEFIHEKTQSPGGHGFAPTSLPPFLFDFQASLVDWALRLGRAAVFADCGLGKTPIQLAWADQIVRRENGRVLILAPLAVSSQTLREGEKFGIECVRSRDGLNLPVAGIVVSNYERIERFDRNDFVGVVADESSILKNMDGVRCGQVINFMRHAKYRLLCTATAAPNDFIELGTSSEALGGLGYMDMLGRFFVADDGRGSAARRGWGKSVKFRLKGHAELPFWRWVCSWARTVRRPSDLGFADNKFILPDLRENLIKVRTDTVAAGNLIDIAAWTMADQREAARRTVRERCSAAANSAMADGPTLLWVNLNDEGDTLERMLPRGSTVQVAGADRDEDKEERLAAFARGEVRYLVTKPKIGGWGLNFQRCAHMTVFPTHSYESYYQGVRRCWRFGQERPVTVDVIGTEGLSLVMDNLKRKAAQADRMFDRLVATMNEGQSVAARRSAAGEAGVPGWL